MRCVLITAFGVPVDPEVKRNFAIVSGPTRACASSTSEVASADSRLKNVSLKITSVPGGTAASIARPNAPSIEA
jgi:hypothetical protein